MAALYHYMGDIPLMSFLEGASVIFMAMSLGWAASWLFVRYYLNAIEPV
jgi:hypothetical protein